MLRRTMLGGLVVGVATQGLGLQGLRAQVLPPADHGTPLRTVPFPPEVYRERRARVMAAMKTGVAVIHGAPRIEAAAAKEPATLQDDDFAWLTGIADEPGAVLVLAPGERTVRETLYLPPRNPEVERGDRERLPLGAEIERRTGFARVVRTGALPGAVAMLAHRYKELHFMGPIVPPGVAVPPALELYGQVMQRVPGVRMIDSALMLPAMRMVKEPRELDLMRRAVDATRAGHLAAMRATRAGRTERDVRETMEVAFRAGGGTGLSYDSIVAGGRNAASLHYNGGSSVLAAGSLLLIDAAASVGGYACDVTRTLPVDGRFTDAQRRQYELVLAAQDAAVARLKAGVYWEDVNEAARDVIRRAGHIDDFYHGVGHLVGLDVHDAGDYSKPLPAGAVVTVEPGLYVQAENYGIRVEDQYLITATGAEWMSKGIPRTVAEIEAVMGARG